MGTCMACGGGGSRAIGCAVTSVPPKLGAMVGGRGIGMFDAGGGMTGIAGVAKRAIPAIVCAGKGSLRLCVVLKTSRSMGFASGSVPEDDARRGADGATEGVRRGAEGATDGVSRGAEGATEGDDGAIEGARGGDGAIEGARASGTVDAPFGATDLELRAGGGASLMRVVAGAALGGESALSRSASA